MHYNQIQQAVFLSRPNRFLAEVALNGETVMAHVKNTGRCRELLIPGTTVYLTRVDSAMRKTQHDLVAVQKGMRLINIDAQAPNQVFGEWIAVGHFVPGLTLLRPETTWGNSRFDFYWEAGDRRGFVEVKGVTLEEEGHVLFPDAPTERGVKHLRELAACQREGYEASIFFVVQMEDVQDFAPNDRTHPAFGDALREAAGAGVHILAYDCTVSPGSLSLRRPVPVKLEGKASCTARK
ncbi:MAG: DNA/RNA nuclease SfsA [Intestinimonas sp.]|nr:DNA/RNA nuclease SfsA [Intestinimonas sp.]